jgi:4-carboxymuconolactone decarboxylase
MISSEEVLRRLAIGDPVYCQTLLWSAPGDPTPHALDARSIALVRLSGTIAAGSAGPLLRQRVTDAIACGLDFDEVVGSLLALAPTLGIERTVAIAPDLALALGYDIDAALEEPG